MTTHTDRKSAEILAALDKLAENGMPFIDVVKQGGFSGFPANGVQPLPTEPVQVHEDPGAAYWKEATKMAEHTDRIRQMAQEAGIDVNADTLCRYDGWLDPITRFAQLVAEDCAKHVETEPYFEDAPGHVRSALFALTDAIRARYSLKD